MNATLLILQSSVPSVSQVPLPLAQYAIPSARPEISHRTSTGFPSPAADYRLMLTCRACDVEPYAYLRHVPTDLPRRQAGEDVNDLLPFNFNKQQAGGQ